MAEQPKEDPKTDLADPEEEAKGNWTKLVDLPEVPVVTGEEEEDLIFKMKTRMYRFRDGQWKERGVGSLKLLRDKKSRQIRLLMRQDKTLKVIANHYLSDKPYCELLPMAGSDKAVMWIANDYSEEQGTNEKLAVKFTTAELANEFKGAFNSARDFNSCLLYTSDAADE
eukprot:TRINITY_DN2349_c0_g1_i13.p2 TRINITY_DN2349_c0_g1~~TRINITY_DN2349_c0_g1_i13.p2  ORF type:complete len:169 (-),score=61.26 TRINITY_DN2349_c0_g1_i13:53-559(-)